jgi:hypothetical protein
MAYYSQNVPGFAQTFGPSMPKPVQVIDRFNKEETARKAAEQAARAEQVKENQKNMLETLKYNPESTIKEYDASIKKKLNDEFIPHVANVYRGGRAPSADELADVRKKQNDIELLVEKQKAVKEGLDGVLTQIKGDKEINQDWVYQRVNDFIYETGEDGTRKLKDLSEIDPDEISQILETPDAYNIDAVVSNFSDNIGENIDTFIKEGGGASRPWRESKEVKSKYLILDEHGDPALDDNGNYVLNLTPSTLKMALSNPRMARAVEQEAARLSKDGTEITKMEAFKSLMAPKAYATETTKRTNATVKDDKDNDGSKYIRGDKKLHQTVEARYDSVGRLLMNQDKQELQRVIGGDIQEATFTNIHPETSQKFETPHLVLYVKNNETTETESERESGEDTIVKTKNKKTGSTAQVFDLSNEQEREKAMYIINRNMTKNNGSKVTDDDLRAYINHLSETNPDGLYHNKYSKKRETTTRVPETTTAPATTSTKKPSFQPGK